MSFNTEAISYDLRAHLFWFLVVVATATGLVYFYAISTIAQLTAQRQSVEHDIAERTIAVAELEFDYIAEQNRITIADAATYGLVETRNPVYASRGDASALSYNVSTR